MACLLGHSHPEIVEIVRVYAASLIHTSSCMVSPPVIRLAERLTSLLPQGLDRAFFLSTGSESNEAAIRLAKTYTGKFEMVGLGQSWHGMTRDAQGVQYQAGRHGHGTVAPNSSQELPLPLAGPVFQGQHMLPQPNSYRSIFRHDDGSHDWRTELDYGWGMVDQASCGSLAACMIECIQGDGGVHVLPDGYIAAIKDHCKRRGMLLIIDEAQTGLGRTGEMFAFEGDGVVPDILTISKPLGNGLPISAVITSAEIDKRGKERGFLFFTTHGNDALVAAVAEKVIEIARRPGIRENVETRSRQLFQGLDRLKDRYDFVGDVRGRGLMAGIEIVSNRGSKTPALRLAQMLSEELLRAGLWCQLQDQRVFRIGPPLTVTEEEIKAGLEILETVFATSELYSDVDRPQS